MATTAGPAYPSASVDSRMKTMLLPSFENAICESRTQGAAHPVSTGWGSLPLASVR